MPKVVWSALTILFSLHRRSATPGNLQYNTVQLPVLRIRIHQIPIISPDPDPYQRLDPDPDPTKTMEYSI